MQTQTTANAHTFPFKKKEVLNREFKQAWLPRPDPDKRMLTSWCDYWDCSPETWDTLPEPVHDEGFTVLGVDPGMTCVLTVAELGDQPEEPKIRRYKRLFSQKP